MESLMYPIGKFSYNQDHASIMLNTWVKTINEFPTRLRAITESITESQLNTSYRPDGWTGRQVVHHLSDSHSHALMRFKWTLTEQNPTIKPYKEDLYAKLTDYTLPIEPAILILEGIHLKWSGIMANMNEEEWDKKYYHPDMDKFFTLKEAAALYAWHCMHHYGHLQLIIKQ